MSKHVQTVRLREQEKETQANRLVLYTALTVGAVVVVAALYRLSSNIRQLHRFRTVVLAMMAMFAIATAYAFYRVIACRGKDCSSMIIPPIVQAGLSMLGLLGTLFMRFFYADAVKLFYVLIPALYAIHLIKQVYGGAFFCLSAFLLGAGSVLYTFDRLLMMGLFAQLRVPFGALLFAIGIGFLVVCVQLNKNKGILQWKGAKHTVVHEQVNYLPGYFAGAIVAAIGALFARTPAYASFYGLIGIGVLLVLYGIYYTYTLMYS